MYDGLKPVLHWAQLRQLPVEMRQRGAKLLTTRLALRRFQLAHDAAARQLEALALLVLLHLLRSFLRFLFHILRRLGILPLFLNRLALESASHRLLLLRCLIPQLRAALE